MFFEVCWCNHDIYVIGLKLPLFNVGKHLCTLCPGFALISWKTLAVWVCQRLLALASFTSSNIS